jgi:putative phosphoribosyl transferase
MSKFINRQMAGRQLAAELKVYANRPDVIVLALPRGGVPVAFEIAHQLHAPLDVFIVRKLGAPNQKELAMGAIATGNTRVLNDEVIRVCEVTDNELAAVEASERKELLRREKIYRGDRPALTIKNKIVILVDDGIATGASMRAAIISLNQLQPKALVIAVPLAPKEAAAEFKLMVDDMICLATPANFFAVGAHYEQFDQTTDKEVCELLAVNQKEGQSS